MRKHTYVTNEGVAVTRTHTGRIGSGTYYYDLEAPTQELLDNWKKEFFREYHPAGYCSTVEMLGNDGKTFKAKAERWGSCD